MEDWLFLHLMCKPSAYIAQDLILQTITICSPFGSVDLYWGNNMVTGAVGRCNWRCSVDDPLSWPASLGLKLEARGVNAGDEEEGPRKHDREHWRMSANNN